MICFVQKVVREYVFPRLKYVIRPLKKMGLRERHEAEENVKVFEKLLQRKMGAPESEFRDSMQYFETCFAWEKAKLVETHK